jgi:ADP-ribose pyrophosphatase
VVFDGRRIRVRRDVYEDAGVEFVREIVEHPGAAVIVPFTADDEVILVRQFRHAIGKTLLELPAGTLEPGEDPEVCAARELMEETGFRAGKIAPLGIVYPSPGVLGEVMHFFAARDLVPCESRPDPGENIEVVRMPISEALKGIRSGAVNDGKTVIGLMKALEQSA